MDETVSLPHSPHIKWQLENHRGDSNSSMIDYAIRMQLQHSHPFWPKIPSRRVTGQATAQTNVIPRSLCGGLASSGDQGPSLSPVGGHLTLFVCHIRGA